MDSGMENQDPHCPSIRRSTAQPPLLKNSFEERGSGVEKPLEEKGQTSSQLRGNGNQRRGSEPKTDEAENSNERKLKGSSSCNSSEAESGSNPESSRKGEGGSGDSRCSDRAGTSLREKPSLVPDAGHSSNPNETAGARPRRAQQRRTGHSKRPRSRSSEVQSAPLRKSLVTSLRAMSEAIYQDTVKVQNQPIPSLLSWEQYALLAQLRGHLCAQAQTIYDMAAQAAYAFPAEGWLMALTMSGPSGPAGNGEARSPSEEGA